MKKAILSIRDDDPLERIDAERCPKLKRGGKKMTRYHYGLGLAVFLAILFLVQPATFSDVNPDDLVVIDTIGLTNPPEEGRPLYLSLTPDGSKLYVVISNPTPRLEVINTATNNIVGGIPLESGGYPLHLVMAPDGARAYLPRSDSRIHVIDTATDLIVDTIVVPNSSPRDAILSLDSSTLYMSDVNTGVGLVHVIDTASGGVLTSIPLGSMGGGTLALLLRDGHNPRWDQDLYRQSGVCRSQGH